jgi:gluconate 2-dehydrogenase subunit 3-like protein
MDRRNSIKALIIGSLSTGVLVEACKPDEKKAIASDPNTAIAPGINRMKEEDEHYKQVISKTFFTPEEMATITILADIIIPKDEISGSASDAKVPDFIEFIVKDMPEHQTPMRGGLRWLDLRSLNKFDKVFKNCSHDQQMELVDEIAWPKKAKPEASQGVSFFSLMRNLTASGFYTTQVGGKDVGYMGNVPNQWNGVPADVLKQYNMAYTEKELKECVSFDKV